MLSVTSRHALRALVQLAVLPEGNTLLGRDLARQAGVPANYLSKILWALGSAGFIDATRGSGGGYRLRKKPEEIRLIEVVGLFEKTRTQPGCLIDEERICSDDDPCTAHEAWQEVRAAYSRFLESTTLAMIAKQKQPAAADEDQAK